MSTGKRIVICQSRGKFVTASDGSLSYSGGEAHALSVNNKTRLDELQSEVAEMWKYDPNLITIKYFLPNNKRTLITISSDKDIQRMIDFHEDAATIDVYVMTSENSMSDISVMPCSGSSRTTIVEACVPQEIHFPAIPDAKDNHDISLAIAGDNKHSSLGMGDALDNVNMSLAMDDAFDNGHMSIDVGEGEEESRTPLAIDVDSGRQKLTNLWKNCITGLHQQFNNVQELRDALRKYAAAHGFVYTYKNNDCQRITAKCKAEGCPWRLHASKLAATQLFRIKKINDVHTCDAGTSSNRTYASKKLVVSILKEKLRDSPNSKPKEIAEEIRRDFGIELRYYQAWRGIETVRMELQGSYKDSYNRLPLLCEKILATNPGSVVNLMTKEDKSFHRIFIAFFASLQGFQVGCRPLLFLDSLTLKSKYQSELLTVSALDGNDGIFPVAFAIVDVVNEDNWHWFLVQLKCAVSTVQPITFVADRKMGLKQSISSIFENSYHGYCLQHLTEELKMDLKGPCTKEVFQVIISHLYDAAYAATVDGFTKSMDNIKSISPEAYDWVLQNEPVYWANALFEGLRFNQITSGIARSFYDPVTEVTVAPVAHMIDTIRRQIMDLIYTRRMDSNQWSTKLVPALEDKLQGDILAASSLQVLFSPSHSLFEVRNHMGAIYVVNIDTGDCSCREWTLTGLPCLHALVVLQRFSKNIYDYCSKYFMTEIHRSIYSESINPIPTVERPGQGVETAGQDHILPPPLRNPYAQPKKRRDRSKGKIKRPLHCSRCKGVGHNRATCHIPS